MSDINLLKICEFACLDVKTFEIIKSKNFIYFIILFSYEYQPKNHFERISVSFFFFKFSELVSPYQI